MTGQESLFSTSEHPCPEGVDCALNRGASTCSHCGRNWPPDSTWKNLPSPDTNAIGKFHGPDAGAPETERAAAIRVYPRTGTARRIVLDFIGATGERGATDDEMQAALTMGANTQRPRRVELLNAGWIEDSGARRKTGTGSDAVAWVLTGAGSEQWSEERSR